MSDFKGYYGCHEADRWYETEGGKLVDAIGEFEFILYLDRAEFPNELGTTDSWMAPRRLKKYLSKLPYAPLTKTLFMKGCQCPKALWFYGKERKRCKYSWSIFDKGRSIHELARHLYPDGIDVSIFPAIERSRYVSSSELPFLIRQNLWLLQSRKAIEDGVNDIYKAAFSYNGVFLVVDMLHSVGNGYVAFEVNDTSDVPESVYIQDCALQYYVMSHNINLQDMFIVYPDEEYVNSLGIAPRDLTVENCDVHKLFIVKSVLAEVQKRQPAIADEVKKAKKTLSRRWAPKIKMGEQCTSPYQCKYTTECSPSDQ